MSDFPLNPPKYSPNQPGYSPGQKEYQPATRGEQPSAAGNCYPPLNPHLQPEGNVTQAHDYEQPIVTQPVAGTRQGQLSSAGGWMPSRQQVPIYVPPGLQYLAIVGELVVKQKVELLEVFIGFETNNKYAIKNRQGETIYYAIEDNDACTRMCLGSDRSFDIKILDCNKTEVIHLKREFACSSCCFPCCLQKLEVYSPPGNLVGTVEQTWSICTPQFDVKNESGDTVLKIEAPFCQCGCNVDFNVLSLDKSAVVGKISKQWSGLIREAFTDADNFGISFPVDLDVRMKAVMLGACFLIDFMYFEKSG